MKKLLLFFAIAVCSLVLVIPNQAAAGTVPHTNWGIYSMRPALNQVKVPLRLRLISQPAREKSCRCQQQVRNGTQ